MKSIKKLPIIFSIFSLIAFFALAKQEKVLQIFRNGEVIKEYAINDIDYIEVNDLIPAPTDVNASVTNDQITINWNPVEGATYNVYRSPDNENFTLLASNLTETSYTDTNPLRGSNFYRVKAVVGDVESGYTSSAAATLTSSDLDNGIYLGITGFNQSLYEYPVLQLTESSVNGFHNFVDGLTMKNGTLLYYSVDQALNVMQSTELPEGVSTAAIVTFTDGLDQGSMMMNVPYDDDMAYLDAINSRLKNETVSGQPITAFSIGIRGKDVADIDMFRTNLEKLASTSDNATEVSSMSEVNAKFKEIAEKLSESNYVQTINLKMPGLSNGTRVRFTFDNVNAANNSRIYIEGKFNLKEKSLEEVQYVGLTSKSGSTVKGTVDGIFVNFTFDGVHTDNNVLIKSEFTDEWTYITSNDSWQINSEFDKTENSDIVTERSSAVIMLVLDCSSSLADDFIKAQNNAKDFINTLYGTVSDSVENPGNDETIYSTIPQDRRAAVWIDNQRYFLSEEEFNSANLSNAYVEGFVVLYEKGYYIISPEHLQSDEVHYTQAMKYYADLLPDGELISDFPYYCSDLNMRLSSFGFATFMISYNYLISEDTDSPSVLRYGIYPGDGAAHKKIDYAWYGLVRGVKRMGDERIEWSKPNHLFVSVKTNDKREFIKFDENVDWSSYDVEGVAINIGDQYFIVLKDENASGNIHKDTALSLYSDIMPTSEQAEVISMLSSDINRILNSIGGTDISGTYFTKTPYDSTNLFTFSADGSSYGYSAKVRGVVAL